MSEVGDPYEDQQTQVDVVGHAPLAPDVEKKPFPGEAKTLVEGFKEATDPMEEKDARKELMESENPLERAGELYYEVKQLLRSQENLKKLSSSKGEQQRLMRVLKIELDSIESAYEKAESAANPDRKEALSILERLHSIKVAFEEDQSTLNEGEVSAMEMLVRGIGSRLGAKAQAENMRLLIAGKGPKGMDIFDPSQYSVSFLGKGASGIAYRAIKRTNDNRPDETYVLKSSTTKGGNKKLINEAEMGALLSGIDGVVLAEKKMAVNGYCHGMLPIDMKRGFLVQLREVQSPKTHREFLMASIMEKGTEGALGAVKSLASQQADVLAAIHDNGVIYRDYKPENILFENGVDPQLTDFGEAMTADTLKKKVSKENTIEGFMAILLAGSPAFTAPELWKAYATILRDIELEEPANPERGRELSGLQRAQKEVLMAVTPQNDVYSWGASLYEMLTGQIPYAGKFKATNFGREATMDIALIKTDPSQDPFQEEKLMEALKTSSMLEDAVSLRPMAQFLAKACHPDPAQRFASMKEAKAALDSLVLNPEDLDKVIEDAGKVTKLKGDLTDRGFSRGKEREQRDIVFDAGALSDIKKCLVQAEALAPRLKEIWAPELERLREVSARTQKLEKISGRQKAFKEKVEGAESGIKSLDGIYARAQELVDQIMDKDDMKRREKHRAEKGAREAFQKAILEGIDEMMSSIVSISVTSARNAERVVSLFSLPPQYQSFAQQVIDQIKAGEKKFGQGSEIARNINDTASRSLNALIFKFLSGEELSHQFNIDFDNQYLVPLRSIAQGGKLPEKQELEDPKEKKPKTAGRFSAKKLLGSLFG